MICALSELCTLSGKGALTASRLLQPLWGFGEDGGRPEQGYYGEREGEVGLGGMWCQD